MRLQTVVSWMGECSNSINSNRLINTFQSIQIGRFTTSRGIRWRWQVRNNAKATPKKTKKRHFIIASELIFSSGGVSFAVFFLSSLSFPLSPLCGSIGAVCISPRKANKIRIPKAAPRGVAVPESTRCSWKRWWIAHVTRSLPSL